MHDFRFTGSGHALKFASGDGSAATTTISNIGVNNVYVDGSNMSSGSCIEAYKVAYLWTRSLYFKHCPQALRALGVSNLKMEHISGKGGEGYGLNDYEAALDPLELGADPQPA